MRDLLRQKYENLFEKYNFEKPIEAGNINSIIKESLKEFLADKKKPAIYCNGGHTSMLMADFMYELKNVKVIVDNFSNEANNSGFMNIRDEEMEQNDIDAVIISSFKFRKDIRERLKKEHPQIAYLDIYEKFNENGIDLQADYYYHNHPYHHYHTINTLQREIAEMQDTEEKKEAYLQLISHFMQIKDFRTAIKKAQELLRIEDSEKTKQLIEDLRELYELEQQAASQIAQNNVVMFCMDGLRRQDLSDSMHKLSETFDQYALSFENAYSFSTSTFESLIPVYSENQDLRTKYYNKNRLSEEESRFVQKAKQQNRKIYFYTDMDTFVDSADIVYSGAFQTVCEKLWNFIMDACEEKNGLFYMHILYESHFTFSNPYTEEKLISEGTAMLFEFLPQKGGKLRTDFDRQHQDALHYLDDVVTPIISKLQCNMLFYADHGNLILDKDCRLQDVPEMKYTCAEEWIRIPFVIWSPQVKAEKNNQLISLMSLNEIITGFMDGKPFSPERRDYVKVARSQLYNPDFEYLYKLVGYESCLLAFEAFIFSNGYKLVIFSNGEVELVNTQTDEICEKNALAQSMFEQVRADLTVCDQSMVKLPEQNI